MVVPLSSSLALLCPVYNDWQSFCILIQKLDQALNDIPIKASIFAVDDGSTVDFDLNQLPSTKNINSIECFSLVSNMGHQRAIAVGLCEIARRHTFDAVVILDSDGEDQPTDVPRLWSAHQSEPRKIVVAQRIARSESIPFQFFYFFYKRFFHFLTGQAIDFGNFCLIPVSLLNKINAMPEIWNHLAASIVRSRIPLVRVPTARGKRYVGNSSMNFIALVLHGFGAMSVFIDIFLVRLLIILISLGSLVLMIGGLAIFIKADNVYWIPEWLNIALGVLGIVFIQIITFALISIFIVLSQRGTQKLPPFIFSNNYLKETLIFKSER